MSARVHPTGPDQRFDEPVAPFLVHPLTLASDGTFATVDDSTNEYIGQHIRVIESTRLGERPMAPGFGVPSAAFGSTFREADVQAVLDQYGPHDVTVDVVDELEYTSRQTGRAGVYGSGTDTE